MQPLWNRKRPVWVCTQSFGFTISYMFASFEQYLQCKWHRLTPSPDFLLDDLFLFSWWLNWSQYLWPQQSDSRQRPPWQSTQLLLPRPPSSSSSCRPLFLCLDTRWLWFTSPELYNLLTRETFRNTEVEADRHVTDAHVQQCQTWRTEVIAARSPSHWGLKHDRLASNRRVSVANHAGRRQRWLWLSFQISPPSSTLQAFLHRCELSLLGLIQRVNLSLSAMTFSNSFASCGVGEELHSQQQIDSLNKKPWRRIWRVAFFDL